MCSMEKMETRRRSRKQCRMLCDWFDQNQKRRRYRNEDETNKAKIKAKNSLENCGFTVENTHTDERFKDKFTRRHGCDGGHQVEVQGRELRGQKT